MSVRARFARLPPAPLPAGEARARATRIALAPNEIVDVATAARALPDPADLAAGTLVIVPAELRQPKSLARSVLAALGRSRTATRALRCSALVARGYVRVGAGTDPETRVDVAWGYVPATGPC